MIDDEKLSTKEMIVNSAMTLFAEKGFTETTIRELAADVGLNSASIYHHFPSKTSILEFVLEDYVKNIANTFYQDRLATLTADLTADDILSCLMLVFPEGRVDYYINVLRVILQEQFRNPFVREIMSDHMILGGERVVTAIINYLIDKKVLKEDTDPDFWAKSHSSLIYAFSGRTALGIGDQEPGYSGLGMVEMLRNLFDLMLKTCKTGR